MEDDILFFVYSDQQHNLLTELESKLGKTYTPGKVNIDGVQFEYTDILLDINQNRYSDMRLVYSIERKDAVYSIYV